MTEKREAIPLPDVATAYIHAVINQMKCPRYMREEVRRELMDHFEDGLVHCVSDEAREAEAASLVSAFGDASLIAELSLRGKRRCQRGLLSGLAGQGLIAFIIVGAILLGSPPYVFVSIPSFIVAGLVPLALSTGTYGFIPTLHALRAVLGLVVIRDPECIHSDAPRLLHHLVGYTYAACAMGVMLAIITLFGSAGAPYINGSAIAVAYIVPLYSLLLAEGCYRPAARRALFLRSLVPMPGVPESATSTSSKGAL